MSELLPAVRRAAERLKGELVQIEARLAQTSEDAAYARIKAALDRCLSDLTALGCWGQANQLPSSELWNIAGDYLARGWLPNRARTKPRGYAGDFEMLARMYERVCCDDPMGRHFDRFFQEEAAPRAVRGRMQLMRQWIVEKVAGTLRVPSLEELGRPQGVWEGGLVGKEVLDGTRSVPPTLHVAVFGSAFGLEVRDAVRELDAESRRGLRVTLLDLDPAAVEFGRSHIEPLLGPGTVAAEAANLFRLPQRPALAERLAGVDLLLCPGLFDYLDDAAAATMLAAFWQRLAPRGRMVVFQFAPHNSSRAFMEWVGNWYLIYRDAQAWQRVVAASGIPPAACSFGAEATGVDLFVSAVRP